MKRDNEAHPPDGRILNEPNGWILNDLWMSGLAGAGRLMRVCGRGSSRASSVPVAPASACHALFWLLFVAGFAPAPLHAQNVGNVRVQSEVFVGSEIENYLRTLQVQGASASYPWSIRSFSPGEVDRLLPRDSAHPWADRYDLRPISRSAFRAEIVAPQGHVFYNSAFPYGTNNGAVWAGRGLTTAIQLGFAARYGPLSVTVAPLAFRAENNAFELFPDTGVAGIPIANGRSPDVIDLPQRFGDGPYTRIDPGQSTLRLDLPLLALGVSTANQHWGPAREHPILLGNNAAGFLHGFAGTSESLNLWVGKVHGRVVWGRLEQSGQSPVVGHGSRRFMSGIVGVFTPRGLDGLELGGARFFHEAWPAEGLSAEGLLKPVEAFWKGSLSDTGVSPGDPKTDFDNQLASAFVRWSFPRSGLEVYGEYGREDHSWNARDFILEPDHSGGYMLGFQKVWSRSDAEWLTLRGEVLNLQVSHIARVRNQWPFYVHGWQPQGHTHHGQVLGSAAGYGGAGALLATDYYHSSGRWSATWSRAVRQDRGDAAGAGERDPYGIDVMHGLGFEGLLFLGRFDVTGGLTGVYNFDRNFTSDRFNLNGVFRIRTAL